MSSTASTVRKKWKDIEEKGTGTVGFFKLHTGQHKFDTFLAGV